MIRIKDPERSLKFYTGVLGMRLSATLSFEAQRFSLYFLEFGETALPADEADRLEDVFSRPAFLELTHNWGTELETGEPYHNGNSDPRGYGHIGISVGSLAKAVEWFDENKVKFVKRPDEGSMKDIVFIADPDGYWVEVIEASKMRQFATGA